MRGMRFLLVGAVAYSAVLVTPSLVQAQCVTSRAGQNQSSTGNVRMQAVTTQANCVNRGTVVQAWIDGGGEPNCLTGDDYPGFCHDQNFGGNASVTIQISNCGPWMGKSDHKYWDGSGPVQQVGSGILDTALNGGTCPPPNPPDCAAIHGPGFYWNGFECTDVASPIVIATNPGQYRFTSALDGVLFDIDGDGDLDQIAWTEGSANVAFLALDIDGDGKITSGKELFGDNTVPGIRNGFEALAHRAQESNGNVVRGSVSSDDPLFANLLLWTDSNHNGLSEANELRPASEVVSAIGLGYEVSPRRDGHGNQYRYKGWAHLRTGPGRNKANSAEDNRTRTRPIYDVFFTREN